MANGPCDGVRRGLFGGLVGVVEALSIGVGRSGATLARSQNEFCGGVSRTLNDKHVAAGAVEQSGEDL